MKLTSRPEQVAKLFTFIFLSKKCKCLHQNLHQFTPKLSNGPEQVAKLFTFIFFVKKCKRLHFRSPRRDPAAADAIDFAHQAGIPY